jgi:site-specific recombinase XerD
VQQQGGELWRMIAKADIRRVQDGMGYADIQTTMRYLHRRGQRPR